MNPDNPSLRDADAWEKKYMDLRGAYDALEEKLKVACDVIDLQSEALKNIRYKNITGEVEMTDRQVSDYATKTLAAAEKMMGDL